MLLSPVQTLLKGTQCEQQSNVLVARDQELNYLESTVRNPQKPFVAIVGGSKVSSKIDVLRSLLDKVDKLIIGCAITPVHHAGTCCELRAMAKVTQSCPQLLYSCR